MRALDLRTTQPPLNEVVSDYERTGEEMIIRRDGKPVARLTPPGLVQTLPAAGERDIVEVFRAIRERVRSDWPDEPEFDWKAAIDEGRA